MAVSLDDPTGMGANDVSEQLAFQIRRVGFVDRQVVLPRVPGEHLWTKEGGNQVALGTKQAHRFRTPLSLGAMHQGRLQSNRLAHHKFDTEIAKYILFDNWKVEPKKSDYSIWGGMKNAKLVRNRKFIFLY